LKSIEGKLMNCLKVGKPGQPLVHLLNNLLLSAGTDMDPPKIRMTHWNVLAEKSQAMADGAIRIANRRSLFRGQ